MFASIVPSIKLPRDVGAFDYAIPDAFFLLVQRGSVVTVPWRGRNIDGLVLAVSQKSFVPSSRVKPIVGVTCATPLPEELVATIEWMSGYYAVSIGTILHALLPSTPKRKVRVVPEKMTQTTSQKKSKANVRMQLYESFVEKCSTVSSLVSAACTRKESAIIIVPHLADIAPLKKILNDICSDNIILFHGDLTPTKLWESWRRALEDGPVTVIGTRMAILAPVSRLGAIIITESDSPDLKQYDQNPRFDARMTARCRSTKSGATLTLMSHAPRAEDVALAAPIVQKKSKTSTPTLVDITASVRTTEEKLLSPSALDAISDALLSKKSVLLFHNRRGTATAVLCRECSSVFRCSACGVALTMHGSDRLHCHRCGTIMALNASCPKCSGSSFRLLGAGTARVESVLATHFPDANIVRYDADTRRPVGATNADILVGTQLLLHDIAELPWEGKPFGAVIATSVDDLLVQTGFRASEEAWRTVSALIDVANEWEAKCILQTLDGENPKIRSLLLESKEFMKKELEDRRRAGFPPYSTLITVTTLGVNEQEARTKAARLTKDLTQLFKENVQVNGPMRPRTPLRHGTWRSVVVMKTKRVSQALAAHLKTLPEDHLVDRDPEYLS